MRQLLATLVASAVGLALAAGAGADPTRHFGTFVLDCGSYGTVEIVSKPGTSQVVKLNGAPRTALRCVWGTSSRSAAS